MLLYIDAVFGVLFGRIFSPIGFLVVVASAAGGFGIANEKRWGYALGVGVSAFGLLILWLVYGLSGLLTFEGLFALLFPVAQFVALVHPMSREYQRIWFS